MCNPLYNYCDLGIINVYGNYEWQKLSGVQVNKIDPRMPYYLIQLYHCAENNICLSILSGVSKICTRLFCRDCLLITVPTYVFTITYLFFSIRFII